jgi:hypothetical protein
MLLILGETPMHSKDTEKTIADLTEFLKSRHPSVVLQFITGMMIDWTHFDKEKQPSKSDIDLAWRIFFNLLRSNIDKRLSLISSQSHSNVRQKVLSVPVSWYFGEKKKRNEIANLLGNMPPDEALHFMVEVTTNWCFSIPVNFLHLVPVTFCDESDEAIANSIYVWLERYYDLWP